MTDPLAALPAVPDTALPADVRKGTPAQRRDYSAALGFEQVLLGQVVQAMIPEDSELGSGPYAGAVQDAFAQGLVDAGGIGLAGQIYRQMQERGS